MKTRFVLPALAALIVAVLFGPSQAGAGGLTLYEVGTADVGLASAGYGARAQDASTVLTNPAGMTRLQGTQVLAGAQVLYGNYDFSIASGTSRELGDGDGGNPIGWFPGGSFFITRSVSPHVALGFGVAGNFGLTEKYDDNWVGRYYVQEAALIGVSLLPSVAVKITDKLSVGASFNMMYGYLKNQVAVNNPGLPGEVLPIQSRSDGQLELKDSEWGFGVNVGLLYEFSPAVRLGLVYNSQVNLDFSDSADFSGLSRGLRDLLGRRGLLGANVDLGIKVPQGAMASLFYQVSDRYALLGSVGWQQWSKFGKVDVGVDSNDPKSLTTNLDFKDTWHVAAGLQHQFTPEWLINLGVAYDSGLQSSSNISPALPSNWAWRFGVGAQHQVSKTFSWGFAAEYAYGGTLDIDKHADAPIALGGRGDLVGSFDNAGVLFLAANLIWKF
jgi:long-chain fatty acid transport protein